MRIRVTERRVALATLLTVCAATPAAAQTGRPSFYAADARLDALVGRALDRQPGLEELRQRRDASEAQIVQARTLPDPVVAVSQALSAAETRVGPQWNTVTLTQGLPWPGVRNQRAAVAAADTATAGSRVEAAERDLILQVKTTYYELAYVDAALTVTAEEEQLLDQYERLAQSRYASGQGSEQAVVKLQAEITRVISRQRALADQRTALAARLNLLANDPPDTPVPAVTLAEVPDVTVDTDALLGLGEQSRPELVTIGRQTEMRTEALSLARLASRPMFTVGVSYGNILARRDAAGRAQPPEGNGRNPLSLSFGLSLPVWRATYDAAVSRAASELAAERSRAAAERNRLALDLAELASRLTTLGEQAALFDRALVPQAAEALRSAEAAYATGQAGVLDLLDSERVLLDVRLVLTRQRVDQFITLARIERAIGDAFPRQP